MVWLRLDDQYDDHPKVVAAGNDGELLDVRGMLFCARRGTDGFIPYTQLPALSRGINRPARMAALLVEVRRWHDDPDAKGWWVHDYLKYNLPASSQEADREAARERMRVARAAKVQRNANGSSPDVRANTVQTEINPTPTPQSASTKHSDDPAFEAFWTAYPKHVAKKAAAKAWRTRIKAGRDPDELITAAKHYALVKQGTDSNYLMHAATFLGPSERYEDYLEPPKVGTNYEAPATVYR